MEQNTKRWCRRCFQETPQVILDANRVMVGKKTKFRHRCLVCGSKSNLPLLRGMAECTY